MLLRGNVRVASPPFHLSSDELRLKTTSHGVEVEGRGKLAFCPCLGTPLAVAFDHAVVAPPGDLLLKNPSLEIYRVPVLWLPYFWLRSPARFGLLPPDLAYRGKDGVFIGDGVHVPWGPKGDPSALDLRAGAYAKGGVGLAADLRTSVGVTSLRYDRLDGGDGLGVDARGAVETTTAVEETIAWDADVLRGARGVASTTELEAASRVYDRGRAEAQLHGGGWTVASGVTTTSPRGARVDDLGAAGPYAVVRNGGALDEAGAYDLAIGGGALRAPGEATGASPTIAYGRGEGGALLATRLGPLGAALDARAAGDVADDGQASGVDGAGKVNADLTTPLVRSFYAADEADPWRHRVAPRVGGALLGTRSDHVLASDVAVARGFGGVDGAAWVADGGASSAIGRWGRGDGVEAAASAGAAGTFDRQRPHLVARWRFAATTRWFGAGAEGAHLARTSRGRGAGDAGGAAAAEPGAGPTASFPGAAVVAPDAPPPPGSEDAGTGHVIVARVRLGAVDGISLGANVAGRRGADPVLARLVTDAPLEPSSGFLAASGWTGGARAAVPWTRWLTTRAGADADLDAKKLVAARATVELRDRCECFVVRASGAHRLGREGVDVWLTIDLAPGRVR